jgi:hypothetical protein
MSHMVLLLSSFLSPNGSTIIEIQKCYGNGLRVDMVTTGWFSSSPFRVMLELRTDFYEILVTDWRGEAWSHSSPEITGAKQISTSQQLPRTSVSQFRMKYP